MQKEQYEWLHSWCDDTGKDDLPRVLLIGDSITNAYQEIVRKLLAGKCYVDYFATSYAADMPIFHTLVDAYAGDSKYDVIHFNNGLHGGHMTPEVYETCMELITAKLCKIAKVILVESTYVYEPGNEKPHAYYSEAVPQRNAALHRIAAKYDCPINPLHAVSENIPLDCRNGDGTHYLPAGSEILAAKVAECILAALA